MLPLPACLGNGWIRLYLYRADVTPSYFQPSCHGNHKASAPVRSSIYNLLTPPSPQPHPKETGAYGEQSAKIHNNTLHFPRRPMRGERRRGRGSLSQQNGKAILEEGGMLGRREELSSLRTEAGIRGQFQETGSGLVRGAGWGPLPSDPQHCPPQPSLGVLGEGLLWAEPHGCK